MSGSSSKDISALRKDLFNRKEGDKSPRVLSPRLAKNVKSRVASVRKKTEGKKR
jgi:hypothetical protein